MTAFFQMTLKIFAAAGLLVLACCVLFVLNALRIAVCAYYLYSAVAEWLSEIDSSLASECNDDAVRFFHMYYVHYVFRAQGLKIKLVRTGIIR